MYPRSHMPTPAPGGAGTGAGVGGGADADAEHIFGVDGSAAAGIAPWRKTREEDGDEVVEEEWDTERNIDAGNNRESDCGCKGRHFNHLSSGSKEEGKTDARTRSAQCPGNNTSRSSCRGCASENTYARPVFSDYFASPRREGDRRSNGGLDGGDDDRDIPDDEQDSEEAEFTMVPRHLALNSSASPVASAESRDKLSRSEGRAGVNPPGPIFSAHEEGTSAGHLLHLYAPSLLMRTKPMQKRHREERVSYILHEDFPTVLLPPI
ncbi:hypothetical protein B0H11DRAFT_1899804 [Mycena galericulata]|nr:hypothetical protein B0H11DRAFT_1899804 [Mycena galericulata]